MIAGKKCIAIIPARGGSKSIPKKNIIPLCGKPLIAWSIEHAHASTYIDDVYVTTDDKQIAAVSKQCGAQIIKRPSKLATDTSSSEDALLHALDAIEKVPPEILKEFYMAGDAEAIIKMLENYTKEGLEHMILWNTTGMFDLEKTRQSYKIMKEVLAYVKG